MWIADYIFACRAWERCCLSTSDQSLPNAPIPDIAKNLRRARTKIFLSCSENLPRTKIALREIETSEAAKHTREFMLARLFPVRPSIHAMH